MRSLSVFLCLVGASSTGLALADSRSDLQALGTECQAHMTGSCKKLAEAACAVERPTGDPRRWGPPEDLAYDAYKATVTVLEMLAPETLPDQEFLAVIATTAKDAGVRQAAAEKVTDQRLLSELTKTTDKASRGVRVIATTKLTSQTLLGHLAQTDPDASVRFAAVDRLTDQAALGSIARNPAEEAYLRAAAVRRITDHAVVADLLQSPEAAVRAAATLSQPTADMAVALIRAETDQKVLASILGSDAVWTVCLAAIEGLNESAESQQYLRDIAVAALVSPACWREGKEDVPVHFRLVAIARSTDVALLDSLYLHDDDGRVRGAAFDRHWALLAAERAARNRRALGYLVVVSVVGIVIALVLFFMAWRLNYTVAELRPARRIQLYGTMLVSSGMIGTAAAIVLLSLDSTENGYRYTHAVGWADLVLSVVYFVVGARIRRFGARRAGVGLAAIQLLVVPLGTIMGIYGRGCPSER